MVDPQVPSHLIDLHLLLAPFQLDEDYNANNSACTHTMQQLRIINRTKYLRYEMLKQIHTYVRACINRSAVYCRVCEL